MIMIIMCSYKVEVGFYSKQVNRYRKTVCVFTLLVCTFFHKILEMSEI